MNLKTKAFLLLLAILMVSAVTGQLDVFLARVR